MCVRGRDEGGRERGGYRGGQVFSITSDQRLIFKKKTSVRVLMQPYSLLNSHQSVLYTLIYYSFWTLDNAGDVLMSV